MRLAEALLAPGQPIRRTEWNDESYARFIGDALVIFRAGEQSGCAVRDIEWVLDDWEPVRR